MKNEWQTYGEVLRYIVEAKQRFQESLHEKTEHNNEVVSLVEASQHIILGLSTLLVGENYLKSTFSFMKKLRKALGAEGVYVLKCETLVLYVGQTGNGLLERLRGHVVNKSSIGQYIKQRGTDGVTVEWYKMSGIDQAERLRLEQDLLNSLKPILNGRQSI